MKDFIQSVFILSFFILASGDEEEIIYVKVGGTAILKTPPADQLQDQYVSWFFAGGSTSIAWRNRYGNTVVAAEPWKSQLKLTYDKLTITNVQAANYGTFTCNVKGAVSKEVTKQYRLLKLSVTQNSAFLLPRESLSLTCEAETPPSRRLPQIHWLNPQGVRLRATTGGQLRKEASTQDNGRWTCIVTIDNKESRAHISVTVMDLLPAEPVPTQYTSKSRPLSLPCSFPAHVSWDLVKTKGIQEVHWNFCSKPDTGLVCKNSTLFSLSLEEKLTWKAHDNRQLEPASDLSKGSLSLVKKLGRKEDRGDYICTMKFKSGVTISRKIHVEVLQILSSPGTELIYGQQVNLTCSSGGLLPSDLQVKWFPPKDASLWALGSGCPAQLTIPEVGKGDNGKWRCELWRNGTQLSSAFITLKIEPKFSVWMLVTISGATVIAVLLLILIFILCRRRQRKMRHLRHRLCQCKNPQPRGFYKT